MDNLSEQEIVRRNKLEKYKELGIDPFGQRFDVKYHSQEVKDLANKEVEEFKANNKGLNDEEMKEQLHQYIESKNINVTVAGRIMFIRKMGKASFFSIQDKLGKIQIYIRKDVVGDEQVGARARLYQLSKGIEHAVQCLGLHVVVGVQDLEVGAPCMRKPVVDSTTPVGVGLVDDTHLRMLLLIGPRNLEGIVLGAIVYQQNLAWMVGCKQRIHRTRHERGGVIARHHKRDQRCVLKVHRSPSKGHALAEYSPATPH